VSTNCKKKKKKTRYATSVNIPSLYRYSSFPHPLLKDMKKKKRR